jgi:hypothetical protein
VTNKSTRREKLTFDHPEALQALCGSNNARHIPSVKWWETGR